MTFIYRVSHIPSSFQGSYEEWRIVWIVMAVVYLIAGTVFIIFGNASLQPWAVPKAKGTSNAAQDKPTLDEKQSDESAPSNLIPLKPQTQ